MTTVQLAAADVAGLIPEVARHLEAAGVYFGHGTANATDEAAALVFFALRLDHAQPEAGYATRVGPPERERVAALLQRRVVDRQPLPYLTGEAWFAGLSFAVDECVLVPRSPIAELITTRFEPWVVPDRIGRVLEIGTGSGCIAIGCALAFPCATVVATDISAAALRVAAANVRRHGVTDRVALVETDHANGIRGPFDLIVSNPPYVPCGEVSGLPREYAHEPELGLISGSDGLDSARRILQDAAQLLGSGGTLVLEVGAQWQALQQAFPRIPFTWVEFAHGGVGVAVVGQADLANM